MTRTISVCAVALALLASSADAQKMKDVGKTTAGTPVMMEGTAKKGADGIITATFRVGLQPVIKTANGDMVMMRAVLMFDCAKHTSASKERWFYFDAKATKEARHDKPGKPGFSDPLKGGLADVAIQAVCAPTGR